MMKKMIFLLVMALLVSCQKDLNEAEMLGENAEIIGTWVEQLYEAELTLAAKGYDADVTLMERADKLDLSKYGFTIKDDGTFIEHKNAVWYDTAPTNYDKFDGQWTAVSDSLLEITVGYWGGTLSYQMRILFLDQEYLGIRYLYGEDRAISR